MCAPLCDCFDHDPAWEGWERWYFGHDETFDERPAVAVANACALPAVRLSARGPAPHRDGAVRAVRHGEPALS